MDFGLNTPIPTSNLPPKDPESGHSGGKADTYAHRFPRSLTPASPIIDEISRSTKERFRLKIEVKQGYNFVKGRLYYVSVTVGKDKTCYTEKKSSNNDEPKWNKKFHFDNIYDLSTEVKIQVYAVRKLHRDKLIGYIECKASDMIARPQGDSMMLINGIHPLKVPIPRVDILVSKVAYPEVRPCKCLKTRKRNLVVCIDGTSNKYSEKVTNVIQLYSRLEKNDKQRTYYNSGIGTYAEPAWKTLHYRIQVLYSKIDLAIAWDFDRIIRGAYLWLSENYEDGDCIFLFGFSRGAYQVRALSAMIDKVGLIHKGNQEQIPFAYELYNKARDEDVDSKMEYFKKTFSHDARVHFVGVWDTVSSVGITRGRIMPDTTTGMKHVCYFRQALALDERRVKFLPEYAYGGATLKDTEEVRSESSQPHTKEVWFAGTHSDIGGGNTLIDLNDPDLLASAPLQWMMYEALSTGLKVEQHRRNMPDWDKVYDVNESLTSFWWLLEFLPIKRLRYVNKTDGTSDYKITTRRLHRGKGRQIQDGQKIHISLESVPLTYRPKALPPKSYTSICDILPPPIHTDLSEDVAGTKNKWDDWKEDDIWARANIIMGNIEGLVEPGPVIENHHAKFREVIRHLKGLTESANADVRDRGHRAISEVFEAKDDLLSAMRWIQQHPTGKDPSPSEDIEQGDNFGTEDIESLFVIVTALSNFSELEMHMSQYELLTLFITMTDQSNSQKSNLKRIVEQLYPHQNIFGTLKPVHGGSIWSTAFSPNGKRVVSGSADNTVGVWDVATGALVLEPFKGHTGEVNAVAYSPDGHFIASASDDTTIRVWDAETGQPVGEPFEGHEHWVRSVAFSPNSECIVSSSNDRTIRVWERETGSMTLGPLKGHTDTVHSVAFSPGDGRRIVSGSKDGTVRVWDAQTGAIILGPLRGHTLAVSSVAFSPDGLHVISGSSDSTVRVWEVETGNMVLGPLKGHTDYVRSVAYSPNGEFIVSGSYDTTIRVWNAQSGESILASLPEHTEAVYSVAFSPDGNYIVSGSTDRTVRLWDAKTGASANPYRVIEKSRMSKSTPGALKDAPKNGGRIVPTS